jgi:hypothetical protein
MKRHFPPTGRLSVGSLSIGRISIGIALVLGLASCEGDTDREASGPARVAPSDPAPIEPSPTDWLSDLETDGTSLYLTTHDCPGRVRSGNCTIKGDFPPRMKAYPLTPWRYADGRWERLSQPGVFSSYAEMSVLPGGLMFVPQDPSTGRNPTGPLRVSLDEGRTWEDWQIPEARRRCRSGFSGPRSGPCAVGVAGDYVVIASNFGWVRRNVDSGDWEDITPPKRRPMNDDDALGYGLLVLDDGTLVATANNVRPGPGGSYRVSRDFGSTWGTTQDNPGELSEVDLVDGSTLYATCVQIDFVSEGSISSSGCGQYRSTDLEDWTKVKEGKGPALDNDNELLACSRVPDPSWRLTESAVRVGDVVYAITYVPYVKGREATRRNLDHLDLPHRVRHVLEVSADKCRTWAPVLNGTRP